MKLTANELKVLKAVDDSEYGDALTDGVWTFSVMDYANFPSARSAGGVVASLSKKGFINADPDSGHGENDACIIITETGAVAYIAAVGAENVHKSIPDHILVRSNTMNNVAVTTTETPAKRTRMVNGSVTRKSATAQAKAAAKAKAAVTGVAKAAKAAVPKVAKAVKAVKVAKAVKAAKAAKPAKIKDDLTKSTDALREAAQRYERDTEHKTAGGNVSINNGDEIAQKLLGKDLDAVFVMAAKALKEDEADLRAKYKHLNVGMQRMALGNRMRAALKK
jgi:hypothetical protein